MRNILQHSLRVAVLAATLAAAGAQAEVYVEGNFVPLRITGDHGLTSDPQPSALMGIIGYGLHPNWAVEAAVGLRLEKDSANRSAGGGSVNAQLNSTYGLYLKPRVQVSEACELFGRVGYLRSKLELADSFTRSSTAWGLGLNYAIDRNTYLTVGYNELFKKDDVTVKGVNLGVGYRF